MCPHEEFEVIYYDGSIMIRRCKKCRVIDFRCEYWETPEKVYKIMLSLFGVNGFGTGTIDVQKIGE